MSMTLRSFVDYLIKRIQTEGILSGNYYSAEEVENDIIDQIWNAYEDYENNK